MRISYFCTAASAAAADLPEIKRRGTLRVLVAEGSPEFFAWKPGMRPGFDREVLEGFTRLQRIDLAIVPVTSWSALAPALAGDKGDLLAGGVAPTDGLARVAEFSAEVFPSRLVVVTRRPHRVIRAIEELRQEQVGVVKGTTMAEAVSQAGVPPTQVDDAIAPGELIAALRSGRVTACVTGLEHAMVAHRADPAVQLGLYLGSRQSLAFGMRKGDVKLREQLNEYLNNLRRTPTWNRLVLTYFGDSAAEILRASRD
jgi:polar amino acid transport system substrate-binding protein